MPSPAHSAPQVPTPEGFAQIQQTAQFAALRKTFRGFAFPVTVAFLVWYLSYIVVATFAVDFVSTIVWGSITVGMVLGLAQFVTTGIITWLYIRFADNTIDPATAAIRDNIDSLTSSDKEVAA